MPRAHPSPWKLLSSWGSKACTTAPTALQPCPARPHSWAPLSWAWPTGWSPSLVLACPHGNAWFHGLGLLPAAVAQALATRCLRLSMLFRGPDSAGPQEPPTPMVPWQYFSCFGCVSRVLQVNIQPPLLWYSPSSLRLHNPFMVYMKFTMVYLNAASNWGKMQEDHGQGTKLILFNFILFLFVTLTISLTSLRCYFYSILKIIHNCQMNSCRTPHSNMIDLEGLNNLQESLALDLSHQIVLCFNVLVTIVHKLVTEKKRVERKKEKKKKEELSSGPCFQN